MKGHDQKFLSENANTADRASITPVMDGLTSKLIGVKNLRDPGSERPFQIFATPGEFSNTSIETEPSNLLGLHLNLHSQGGIGALAVVAK